MDILIVIGILFLGVNLRYPTGKPWFRRNEMNKAHTDALKGMATLIVIMSHLLQVSGAGVLAPYFKRAGLYAVVIFFVLSGYGLVQSYKRTGCDLAGFWKKRASAVFIPYTLSIILYIIIRLLIGETLTIAGILLSFVNGSPVVRFSWFVEVIILFYAVFYLSAKYAREDIALICFVVGVFSVIYFLTMQKLGFESFWYNTIFSFVIGMVWAHKSVAIQATIEKHYGVYLVGTVVVFASIFYCTRVLWLWGELGECLVTSLFALVILMLQYLVNVRSNPVTRFIGTISFDMYLIHGALLMILTPVPELAESPLLLGISIYFNSLLFAWILHFLTKNVTNALRLN